MARINTVKKARKDQGNCRACGKPILAGPGYKYKEPRYGGKIKVHEGSKGVANGTGKQKDQRVQRPAMPTLQAG